jgi:molybdopterin-guanine dinucleotide biosynthesis protein A
VKFNNISGVILAGGANSRFSGKIKANLVIDGRAIISGIAELLSQIFPEIIIVTNTPAEFNEYCKFRIVSDQFKMAGPLGGIHAAMKASSGEAVFVVAGDMPLLNKKIIIRQAKYFQNVICDILVPSLNQKIEPLHAVYSLSILKKLEEHLSEGASYSLREFFKKTDIRYLEFDDVEETESAFTNINTPSDILLIEEILKNRG